MKKSNFISKTKPVFVLACSLSLFFTLSSMKTDEYSNMVVLKPLKEKMVVDGADLFKKNCSACHNIGKGRLVGPDLKGVTTKRAEAWLLKWTKSSQSLVKSGDNDAVAIFNEYNKIPMPDQNLSDEQIKVIYTYIESVK